MSTRDPERRSTAPIKRGGQDAGKRPHVLIVDDQLLVRALVERALREDGYVTTIAADGREALHLAARLGPFDVVITDVRLPHVGGYELVQQLRRGDPYLRVLFLTQLFGNDETGRIRFNVATIREAVRRLVHGERRRNTRTGALRPGNRERRQQ